jgi:hypothetical protein
MPTKRPTVSQEYHTKKLRPDGSKSWQGGRDLASTATFTYAFCEHLLACWERRPSVAVP